MSLDRAEFEPFRCDVEPARESVFVRPVGELDLSTVPVVDAQLSELVDAGFRRLVLDLRELRFLDSTGLRLLLSWDAKTRAEGVVRVQLVCPRLVPSCWSIATKQPLGSVQRKHAAAPLRVFPRYYFGLLIKERPNRRAPSAAPQLESLPSALETCRSRCNP